MIFFAPFDHAQFGACAEILYNFLWHVCPIRVHEPGSTHAKWHLGVYHESHPSTQWAAVATQRLEMRTPPHMSASDAPGTLTRRWAIQGN